MPQCHNLSPCLHRPGAPVLFSGQEPCPGSGLRLSPEPGRPCPHSQSHLSSILSSTSFIIAGSCLCIHDGSSSASSPCLSSRSFSSCALDCKNDSTHVLRGDQSRVAPGLQEVASGAENVTKELGKTRTASGCAATLTAEQHQAAVNAGVRSHSQALPCISVTFLRFSMARFCALKAVVPSARLPLASSS